MVKTILLDGKHNYICNKTTGEIIEKYNPELTDIEVHIKLDDDNKLTVDDNNIKVLYGGVVIIQYNEDRFIIDDGYNNQLIKAGYIVYKDYDNKKVYDQDKGCELRNSLFANVSKVMDKITKDISDDSTDVALESSLGNFELKITTKYTVYTVNISSVTEVVRKNQARKANSLPFYAFDKNIDMYGAVYLSLFKKKIENIPEGEKDSLSPEMIIKLIMNELGIDYHFVPQLVKKGLLYFKGI